MIAQGVVIGPPKILNAMMNLFDRQFAFVYPSAFASRSTADQAHAGTCLVADFYWVRPLAIQHVGINIGCRPVRINIHSAELRGDQRRAVIWRRGEKFLDAWVFTPAQHPQGHDVIKIVWVVTAAMWRVEDDGGGFAAWGNDCDIRVHF